MNSEDSHDQHINNFELNIDRQMKQQAFRTLLGLFLIFCEKVDVSDDDSDVLIGNSSFNFDELCAAFICMNFSAQFNKTQLATVRSILDRFRQRKNRERS